MDELRRFWKEHVEEGYPDGYRDKDIAGMSLILLDTETEGIVSQCLGGARLGPQQTAILLRCHRDLAVVRQKLTGPARNYFDRLARMAAIVLEALGRAPRAV